MKKLVLLLSLAAIGFAQAVTPAMPRDGAGLTNAEKVTFSGNALSAIPTSALADPTLQGLAQSGLEKTWTKLATMSANGGSTARLTMLMCGDSLGSLVGKYVWPRLKSTFGDAGYIGLCGTNDVSYPSLSGQPAIFLSDADFDKSPTSTWVPIASTGQFAAITSGTQSPSAYPYTWSTGSSGITADTIKLYYVKESGAGTFKLQVSTDTVTWTDVSGYTAVSAANGSTALGTITATITPQVVMGVRALWVSGSVKIIGGGMINSAASGVVIASLSRGGMDMVQFSQSAFASAVLADIAPDLVTFVARDSDISASLTAFNGILPSSPDVIYMGMNEASGDAVGYVSTYNATIKTFADAHSALYFDWFKYQRSYTIANALGWMTDVTHPNDKLNSILASNLMRVAGLDVTVFNRVPFDTTRPGPIGGTTPSTGSFTSLATTTGDLTVPNGHGFQLDVNSRAFFSGGAFRVTFSGVEYFATSTAGVFAEAVDFITTTAGKTLKVKSGSNAKAGTFTLSSGTATIANTSWTANSVMIPTLKTTSGTVAGNPYVTSSTVGTSFTVTGGGSDNSTYNYVILEVN